VIGFVVWVSLPTGGLPGRWFVVLSAKRIPLTGITAAGFSSHARDWAPLIVTAQRRRHVILAVQRNQNARPDPRLEADEAVGAIRAAAALPRS
jgi:hypothetical protein